MTSWLLIPKPTCPPFPSSPAHRASFPMLYSYTNNYTQLLLLLLHTYCVTQQHSIHHTQYYRNKEDDGSYNGTKCRHNMRSNAQLLLLHLCASNQVKCGPYTQPYMSKCSSNTCFWFMYKTTERTLRPMHNLPTRSRLAISAALTPSAAFVPARITAERRKKDKKSPRECSLSNRKNVLWMMQTLNRALRTVLAS